MAVSTALFRVQIDYFAVNFALPRMAADLGSSTTDMQWVASIHMLALGAFMVPAGRKTAHRCRATCGTRGAR